MDVLLEAIGGLAIFVLALMGLSQIIDALAGPTSAGEEKDEQ
jgi:hypothetical protein